MRFFWLLAGSLALVVPAQADSAQDVLAQLAKCSNIAAATERLDCYDAAARTAKTAVVAPASAQSPDQQVVAKTDKDQDDEGGVLGWFGLSRPTTKAEDFGKPPAPVMDGPKEVTEISAGVIEMAKNAYGRALFVLDNGQVWKQIDGDQTEVNDPKSGEFMKVTIEKALFGSYALKVEGRRGIVKVRRVK
jgi:Type VI secretion system VasI, EvfG, VC_A0118